MLRAMTPPAPRAIDPGTRRAADWNYCLANGAFMGTSGPGEAFESAHVCITCCGGAARQFNTAFLKAPVRHARAGIERAEAYFRVRELPFRLSVRSDVLEGCRAAIEGAGYRETNRIPAMVLEPLADGPAPPRGLRIREVDAPEDLAAFGAAAFAGFGLPEKLAPHYLTEQLFALPPVRCFAGEAEGRVVATSLLFATPPVAGIYWVATREEYRRRGYGEALTWAAVRAARGTCSFASLQSSQLGRPVYERMGFALTVEYVQFEAG